MAPLPPPPLWGTSTWRLVADLHPTPLPWGLLQMTSGSGGAAAVKADSPSAGVRQRRSLPRDVLVLVLARPLPVNLMQAVAAAAWLLNALSALAYHTSVFILPLALWLLFSPGGAALPLPPQLLAAAAAAHPALAHAPPVLYLPPLRWPAALLLLLLLRWAELWQRAKARQAWEQQLLRATPEQVERAHSGFALPGAAAAAAAAAAGGQSPSTGAHGPGGGSNSGSGGGQALPADLADEVAALYAEVLGGQGSQPIHLSTFGDAVTAVGRLCQETGVAAPAGAELSVATLAVTVQLVRQAVGAEPPSPAV